MDEPGWLTFYTAAREIEQRLGGSQAEAQAKLRLACAHQKIRSMKAPYDEPGQLPIEFWTRIAPSEWRKREVDYDGPDASGCKIEVMINEGDFQHWLAQHQATTTSNNDRRSSPKQASAKQAIDKLWPNGILDHVTNKQIVRAVSDWLEDYWKRENLPKIEISRDTILRAAGRK